MLVTLLTAGGWDGAMIRDALTIYSSTKDKQDSTTSGLLFPATEKDNVLPEIADNTHSLLEHNPEMFSTETVLQEKEKTEGEPQSLIDTVIEKPNLQKEEQEIPDNLSIRPFESTENVWPFSRYKDVFHGDTMVKTNEKIEKEEEKPKVPIPTTIQATEEPKKHIIEKHIVIDKIRIAKTPLSRKEEGLVILASTMLVLVIMLLSYMYINGRL
jgi:hypothetical protein